MEEIWKDIEGYEGLYQISNLGNVKSLNYRGRGYAQTLVPKRNNRGRLWVELKRNGKRKPMLIHRLVAMAFIENPNDYQLVNHKDENPENNNVNNLEWCTNSYNVLYSLSLHPERLGNHIKRGTVRRRTVCKKGIPHKYKSTVVQLSKDGAEIQRFDNIASVCAERGWRTSSLLECCVGKRKSAYGYIWRFAN